MGTPGGVSATGFTLYEMPADIQRYDIFNVCTKRSPHTPSRGFIPPWAQKADEGVVNGALPGPISGDLGSIQTLPGDRRKPLP